MMRRWGLVWVAVLLAFSGVARLAEASPVGACKRRCAVFMRGTCRRAVHGGVKSCMDVCKPLFDPHTHKCKVGADCMGFTNFSQCRTACTRAGSQEARNKCGKDARKTCQTCCDTGTIETCVHSPSGAFLDF
jgi:hypothetical protein